MKSKMIGVHIQIVLGELLKEQDWRVESSKEGVIFYLPSDLELYSTDPDILHQMVTEYLDIAKIDLIEMTRFDFFQHDKWLGGIFLYPEGYEGNIPEKR